MKIDGRCLRSTLTTLLLMLGPLQATLAQETSASLDGQVIDLSGAGIANATIEVVHVPSGRVQTLSSAVDGSFSLRNLKVGGPYIVRIADSAYSGKSIEDVHLGLGDTESVVLVAVGADQSIEEITVVGMQTVQGLQTGSGRSWGIVAIQNQPSISRDIKSIIQTDPRAMVDSTQIGSQTVSIAGSNVRYNSLTVDGMRQNDDFGLSPSGYPTRRSPVSLDAIEAMSVNIAPYDVEYGNFSGGNINIVTKSGTNQFHSSAFFATTSDSMAGDKSEGQKLLVNGYEEDQFGFTLGGPIVKDKLWFFAAYEKADLDKTFASFLGNEDGILEANEIDLVTQAEFERVTQVVRDVYGIDLLGFNVPQKLPDEKLLIKLDWDINDVHRLAFTYQDVTGAEPIDFNGRLTNNAADHSNRYNKPELMRVFNTQVFSNWTDSLSTEFKIGFKEVKTDQIAFGNDLPMGEAVISTANGGTIFIGPDRFRHFNDLDNDYRTIKLKVDYLLGDHLLTFGYEQDKLEVFNAFVPWSRGEFRFASIDDLEAQQSNSIWYRNATTGDPMDGAAMFESTTHTFYVQDEWGVSEVLTVMGGLRFEEISNGDPVPFNQNCLDRNGFGNTYNFDGADALYPRLGFNWQALDRVTIRGGFDKFGGGTPNVWLSNSYSDDGVRQTLSVNFGSFPGVDLVTIPQDIYDSVVGAQVNGNVSAVRPGTEPSQLWKYNLAADIDLGKGWDATIDFLYTDVDKAYMWVDTRLAEIGTAPDGRPRYAGGPYDVVMQNTSKGGGTVASALLSNDWDTQYGLFSFNAGYSYQDIKEVNPGNRFTAFGTYGELASADRNADVLYTAGTETEHRFTATLNWENFIFGDNRTAATLFFSSKSGRHYTHTFSSGNVYFGGPDITGSFNGHSLYVPDGASDLTYGSVPEEFLAYIDRNSCLSKFKGQIMPRNACTSDTINVSVRPLPIDSPVTNSDAVVGSVVDFVDEDLFFIGEIDGRLETC